MALEIKHDKAWWSTDPKYSTIQVPSTKSHEEIAINYFNNSYVGDPILLHRFKAISMQELGYVRAWKYIGTLFIEGKKDAIKKILPQIIRFGKEENFYRIDFEYFTEVPSKDGLPKFKSYSYELQQRSVSQLMGFLQ